MFTPCAECGKDTFGKKAVKITITNPEGKLEYLPFYFHYDCLNKLWKIDKYINTSILADADKIFKKV